MMWLVADDPCRGLLHEPPGWIARRKEKCSEKLHSVFYFFFFLYKSFKTVRFDISFLKAENYFGDFSGGPTVKTAFRWSRSWDHMCLEAKKL